MDRDALALSCFATVLGYWLCVPGTVFARQGIPALGDPTVHAFTALHHLLGVLYEFTSAPDGELPCDFGALNSVRSFLMMCAPHHMSTATYELLLRELERDGCSATDPSLCGPLRELLAAFPVGTAWSRLLPRPRGGGRPRDYTSLASRVCTAYVNHPDVLARLPRAHVMHRLTPEGRITMCNLMVYEFLVRRGVAMGQMPRTHVNTVLRDYLALVDPLTEYNYRRNHYQCHPDQVAAWQHCNEFFRTVHPKRYVHAEHVLRTECDSNGISALVRFLQQLERFISLSDAQRALMTPPSAAAATEPASAYARRVHRTDSAATLVSMDSALAETLRRLYEDPQLLLAQMPVSTFYCGSERTHEVATYEQSLCVVDITPPPPAASSSATTPTAAAAAAAQTTTNPNRVVFTRPTDETLTHGAIDISTAFARAFHDEQAIRQSRQMLVHNGITAYMASGGKTNGGGAAKP